MDHFTRTTTTSAPAIQKAGDVRMRDARPPDCPDAFPPRRLLPMLPPPPNTLPSRPEPLPMIDVKRLILYYYVTFYLRSTSINSTAPPAHAAGEFMRLLKTVDVPPLGTKVGPPLAEPVL